MKYYKIKLPYNGSEHVYPLNYDNTIGRFNQGHVYYDDETDGVFTLLISIPDDKVLATLPTNVTEVTEAEATILADKYDPEVTVITSEAVVRLIEIKSRLNLPLSTEETKALDPNDPTLGFGKSQNFVSKIKAKEGK